MSGCASTDSDPITTPEYIWENMWRATIPKCPGGRPVYIEAEKGGGPRFLDEKSKYKDIPYIHNISSTLGVIISLYLEGSFSFCMTMHMKGTEYEANNITSVLEYFRYLEMSGAKFYVKIFIIAGGYEDPIEDFIPAWDLLHRVLKDYDMFKYARRCKCHPANNGKYGIIFDRKRNGLKRVPRKNINSF